MFKMAFIQGFAKGFISTLIAYYKDQYIGIAWSKDKFARTMASAILFSSVFDAFTGSLEVAGIRAEQALPQVRKKIENCYRPGRNLPERVKIKIRNLKEQEGQLQTIRMIKNATQKVEMATLINITEGVSNAIFDSKASK